VCRESAQITRPAADKIAPQRTRTAPGREQVVDGGLPGDSPGGLSHSMTSCPMNAADHTPAACDELGRDAVVPGEHVSGDRPEEGRHPRNDGFW